MAQIKKEHINNKILEVSKKLLISYGYEKMSMRKISSEVGVSVSNLYNYYKNKEAVLQALVGDKSNALLSLKISEDMLPSDFTKEGFLSYLDHIMSYIVSWLDENKELMIILLLKVKGSSYENFEERFINHYLEFEMSGLSLIDVELELPSEHLISQLLMMYFNTIKHYLMYDLDIEWLKKHVKEMNHFVVGGLVNANTNAN